jgi:nucleoid-associated protein YgaU
LSSLTAHLLEPGDHGRLPFHPGCPVCRRERLSGTLSTEPVVSRRARAVLASGVLAVSGGTPRLAAAAVPDREAEGVAAPEQPPASELDDPEFDPGGETSLPFETAPVPTETDNDDGEGPPIDAEPVDDPDGRLAPLVAEGEAQTEEETAPLSEGVPPTTGDGTTGMTTTPSPPPTVPPAVEEPTAPDSTSTAPGRETERQGSVDRSERSHRRSEDRSSAGVPDVETPVVQAPVQQAPAPPPVETPVTVPATGPASAPQATAVAERQTGPSLRNARTYVVQPGDSLWSIAKRLLGADASPARIARAVDRLWSLNQERIATGDPDLLHVGTELRLR